MEWSDMSAEQLGRLLRSGVVDARELTEYFIGRIQACGDPAIFISTTFDRARREAEESHQRQQSGSSRGLLDGVPVTWKDLFDIEGYRTTAGSHVYREAPLALQDAESVRQLARAGMVSLGKTNLTEFAYSALGLNPHYGTPRNVRSPDVPRVPGGSSSGTAASVAAGLAPVGIGTDTGGSIRTPASFNGLTGFKSSAGWVSTRGVFPLSFSLDTVGLICRTPLDCFLVDRAIRGAVAEAPGWTADADSLSTIEVVVPDNDVLEGCEDAVVENFHGILASYARAGVRVTHETFPELEQLRRLLEKHGNIAAAEGYWVHQTLLESDAAASLDPRVRERLGGGRTMSAIDYIALQRGRAQAAASLWHRLGSRYLAMPTNPHVAPELRAVDNDPALFAKVNLHTIRNTNLGNLLDACAIAMPSGHGLSSMPTSISLCSAPGSEDRLLASAIRLYPLH